MSICMDCGKCCKHNHWRCPRCKKKHARLRIIATGIIQKVKLYVHRTGLKRIGTYKCEVCGSKHQVDAHHDSYLRPLHVRWLCKKHHRLHHAKERLDFRKKTQPWTIFK